MRHTTSDQSAECGRNFAIGAKAAYIAGAGQKRTTRPNQVALRFRQCGRSLKLNIEVEPCFAPDPCQRGFKFIATKAPVFGLRMLNFRGKGRKVIFKDEINDPLVRTKAVFQRYFFGENLNLPDCFGRQVPKFAKT